MKYEQELLAQLTVLRTQYANSSQVSYMAKIDSTTTKAVKSLFAVAENYPDLKANTTFLHLQKRISALESQIADRREIYNDFVNIYNIRIQQFPDVILAIYLNYKPQEMFKVSEKDLADIDASVLSSCKKSKTDGSSVETMVRKWLEVHTNLLMSFDMNKDSKIDSDEISKAFEYAKKYAEMTKITSSQWFLYKNNVVEGPYNWNDVQMKIGDDVMLFVNLSGENVWLPYIVIDMLIKNI
jgi:hypothetical protein